jgi:hypothetical protein
MKNPKSCQHPRRGRGFALVISLSLMVLLTILAVGLLGLSTISLRSVSRDLLMQEARQNARMALVLAIGELQSAAGPDQRITATAGALDAKSPQPHLTGAWEGWKWDGNGPVPDFEEEKSQRFLRWLTSSQENGGERSPEFAQKAPDADSVFLVTDDMASQNQVRASKVAIGDGRNSGSDGFAWAVFDESMKLPIALPEPEGDAIGSLHSRMLAAPLPGYPATTEREWGTLAGMKDERLKLVTAGQSALAELAATDRGFHDVTSGSAGIAVDVSRGGLAADLSRAFDIPAKLPDEYAARFLYSGTNAPLVPAPARFQGANPFPSPDPSWRLLHSHYRMFDSLTGGNDPSLANSRTARPPAGTTGGAAQNHPFFHSQQILPVIAKAQFVFSMSFGWHSTLDTSAATNNSSLPEGQKDHYITWLVIDPVITLWNPYNVSMRFSGGRIDLYRVPLAFRLYKNGQLINSEFTHLANTFVSADMGNRNDTYYRLNLLPDYGKSEIVLAPGEHVVLTASNHVKHFGHDYQRVGLDLRPGFSPPAGNASKATVGGTSTLNVCVSSTGTPSGRDYGRAVRTVAVKANDQIQIEVKPLRAKVDKPAETGGKEISGLMKYYVGPPNAPQLVGGIEFDYGDQEGAHLEQFEKEDLPTFVVSPDIPRNVKADDYQGSKPPVVVRFKEPFLISTFQLKSERDSKFASRGWIHNSPVNSYASTGLDQTEPWAHHQSELKWEVMTDWPPSSPTIEISNAGNRGYGGPGVYAQSGLEFATHSSLPLAPALSLPQLRHAPLNTGGQLPLVSQIVANSFPPPMMNPDVVRSQAGDRSFLDHSWFANSALFDGHFFSGIANPGGPMADGNQDANSRLAAFLDQGTPLPNSRFIPYPAGSTTAEIVDRLTAPDGHRKSAAHLLIDSPFNVNCGRVDVWEALLASTFGTDVPVREAGNIRAVQGEGVPVLRHLPALGQDFESQVDPVSRDTAKWSGYRRLEADQVRELAEEVVREVRERGPFLSLAEFINRRPVSGDLGRSGALQAALEKAGINDALLDPAFNIPTGGNTADGAPGVLTQADLLTPLAPILTARGDTFRIRAYGEAGGPDGTTVRAWCEAVVQRVPDYLDPAEKAWETPALPVNQRFGRRFVELGFRWLSPSEI